MFATLATDLSLLGAVLLLIFIAWLYLKRECEVSPLVGTEVSSYNLEQLGVIILIALAGVGADRFWGGIQAAALAIAVLLTILLILIFTTRHYPHSRIGKAFAWVIGRKPDLLCRPSYVLAESLRSQGRVQEAVIEIDRQLAKAPRDFTGLVLSAELAAVECNNLPLAERVIEDLLNGQKRSKAEVVFALHRLAEWRLATCSDPEAGAEPLYRLARMFPNSQEARNARIKAEEIRAAALSARR